MFPAPQGGPPGDGETPVQSTRGRSTLGVGFALRTRLDFMEISEVDANTYRARLLKPRSPARRGVRLTILNCRR